MGFASKVTLLAGKQFCENRASITTWAENRGLRLISRNALASGLARLMIDARKSRNVLLPMQLRHDFRMCDLSNTKYSVELI